MTLATEPAANRPLAMTPTVFAAEPRGSYVDWGAVIAGAVVAAALSLVLLTFGSALGLGLTSLEPGEGVSPLWLAIAAAIWLLWVQVSSFMAGGYLAGRLRRPIGDAEPDEVDIRDGSHGLLVWGTGTLVGGLMLTSGLLGAVQTTAEATSNVAAAAVQAAGSAAEEGAPYAGYLTDTLFRDAPTGNAAEGGDQARSEAGRIVGQALVEGEITGDDRARLVEIVAEQTGTEPAQVEARVAAVEERLQQQAEAAVEAAETARRWSVIAAFIAAATMLVSAAGAYWAATMGGNHRDAGLLTPFWRRTR